MQEASDFTSKMSPSMYPEGYFERGEGSNYVAYGYDAGWSTTVRAMLGFLAPGSKVYEIASAKGYFLKTAAQFYDVEGIDISEYAVANAPTDIRHSLHLGNATSLPWGPSEADAICSWEFLEHVPEDELEQVYSEMERVVKPGGFFIHRIGCLESEKDRSNHMHDHTHVTNYPSAWWRMHLLRRGWIRQRSYEDEFNFRFADRDWKDRFFVYKMPVTDRRRQG